MSLTSHKFNVQDYNFSQRLQTFICKDSFKQLHHNSSQC